MFPGPGAGRISYIFPTRTRHLELRHWGFTAEGNRLSIQAKPDTICTQVLVSSMFL